MKLISPEAAKPLITDSTSSLTRERRQEIFDHLSQQPSADVANAVHQQLMGSMEADELSFLKAILGLDQVASSPAAAPAKAASRKPTLAPAAA